MKTYNPKKVIVSFGGQILTGFADGTAIEVERRNDSFSLTVGIDGEGARSANQDRSGSCKLTLMQSSLGNDILSNKLAIDEQTNLGTGPLMIKDLSGRTLVHSDEAWVKKPAPIQFGKEVSGWAWELECADLDVFAGGN